MATTKDYYDILGVKRTAGQDEIKRAFRKLAHQHHPDKDGDHAKFKECGHLSDTSEVSISGHIGFAAKRLTKIAQFI